MEHWRFDRLTVALATPGTRRQVMRLLATVPTVGALASLLGTTPAQARRRGQRRHNGDGHPNGNGKGKGNGKGRGHGDGNDAGDGVGDPGCNIECCMNCDKRRDYFLGRIQFCIEEGRKTCEACGRWTGCLGFIETGTRCGRVLATCGS
jgi:hypothetical protein